MPPAPPPVVVYNAEIDALAYQPCSVSPITAISLIRSFCTPLVLGGMQQLQSKANFRDYVSDAEKRVDDAIE